MSIFITQSEIKEWGDSLAIMIPSKLKNALKLQEGTNVNISVDKNKIILEISNNQFFRLSDTISLSALTKKISPKNRHCSDEISDTIIGKEVW